MTCAKCNRDNPADAQFCQRCGAQLELTCPACGAANGLDANFCKKCGARLTSETPPADVSVSAEKAARRQFIAETTVRLNAPAAGDIPEGERKTVTALFADIKGSMELMEDLDPEEARAIVDPALRLMIDAVHRYDGYIVQSTGDGIFALFGAPVAHEDHPQRALYAALRMQEDIRRYAEQLRSEGKPPLQVRVGANTGEAVVRSIRTGEAHAEYTPIGHSTSLAARMQVLAPIGSIAIAGDMQETGGRILPDQVAGAHAGQRRQRAGQRVRSGRTGTVADAVAGRGAAGFDQVRRTRGGTGADAARVGSGP
jgi:class 3 adenylate cyclase/ribosomal protein L40E